MVDVQGDGVMAIARAQVARMSSTASVQRARRSRRRSLELTCDARRAWRDFVGPVYAMADVRSELLDDTLTALIAAVDEYAIYMLDPVGAVVSWNAGARRIKGYTDDEIVGHHFSLFFTNDDVSAGRPQLLLAEAAAAGHTVDEGWRVRRDGSRFWANVVITALFDATGQVIGFLKVTKDDTERRQAQLQADQLRQMHERERMARHINNTVINRIFSAGLVIEGLRSLVTDGLLAERIDQAVNELDNAINDLRSIVFDEGEELSAD